MEYMATITSKRQFTIPAAIFKKANFKSKQKVLVRLDDHGVMKVESMKTLIKQLAGSVKIPNKYKGMDIDKMIEKAKFDHFSKEK
jgi:bifunctional DNA-binding transcriptional regulator/antitoxin component of YhaV-PrlF toxin-antitoxin module